MKKKITSLIIFATIFVISVICCIFCLLLPPNHEFGEWIVVIEPTCLEEGLQERYCHCGEKETDVITPLGHDEIIHKEKKPTCTTIGWDSYVTCSRCDYTSYEELPSIGHNYETYLVNPTCTNKGYTAHICACGDGYVDNYVDAIEHTYEAKITHSTKTEKGYTTYTCACGDSYIDDYTDVSTHTYTPIVTNPTCISKGYTTYTCECGDSYVANYIDKLSHKYVEIVTNPTCVAQGYTTYTCACGDSYVTNYIDKLPHTYTPIVTNPTCISKGYTTYTCVCGDSYVDEYVDVIKHNFILTETSCSDDGYILLTCENCGTVADSRYDEPAKDYIENNEDFDPSTTKHVPVIDKAKVPTCSETGLTEGSHCKDCGAVLIEQKVIPMVEHKLVVPNYYTLNSIFSPFKIEGNLITSTSHVTYNSSTFTIIALEEMDFEFEYLVSSEEDRSYLQFYVNNYFEFEVSGTTMTSFEKYTVSLKQGDKLSITFRKYSDNIVGDDCGYVRFITPMIKQELNLSEVSNINKTLMANCTIDVCCSVCNAVLIEKTGHELVRYDGKIPNCEEEGMAPYDYCRKCDFMSEYIILPKEHKYSTEVVDATCKSQGYTIYTCTYCNESHNGNYTELLNHERYSYIIESEPTCVSEGYKEYICTKCNIQERYDYIASLGHETMTRTIPPTCTEEGKVIVECIRCGDYYVSYRFGIIGHVLEEYEGKEPTCTEKGYKPFVACSVCEYNTYEEIPPTHKKLLPLKVVENYIVTNDGENPFKEEGKLITSTNKDGDSSSTYTIIAKRNFTLTLEYKTSSEENWDKLTVCQNGTNILEASGEYNSFTSFAIELNANDVVTITYAKDSSYDVGDDCVYIRLITNYYSIERSDELNWFFVDDEVLSIIHSCKEDVVCDICEETIALKATHDYQLKTTTNEYKEYECSKCLSTYREYLQFPNEEENGYKY